MLLQIIKKIDTDNLINLLKDNQELTEQEYKDIIQCIEHLVYTVKKHEQIIAKNKIYKDAFLKANKIKNKLRYDVKIDSKPIDKKEDILSVFKLRIIKDIPDCFGGIDKCRSEICKHRKQCRFVTYRKFNGSYIPLRYIYKIYYLKYHKYPMDKEEAMQRLQSIESMCDICYLKDDDDIWDCSCISDMRPLCFKAYDEEAVDYVKLYCEGCRHKDECKRLTEEGEKNDQEENN